MNRLFPIALLILAMASIQVGATLAKRLFPLVGPDGAVALRLTMAALILLAVWRPWRARPTRAQLLAIAPYGVSLGLMNLLFYAALKTTPLGVAVALEFTGPLLVALAASRRLLDLVWIVLAVGGILLLSPIAPGSQVPWSGAACALAAGACWAIYILVGKSASAGDRGLTLSVGMTIAALVGAPLGVVNAGPALLGPQALTMGLGLALFCSVIPYTLELVALARLPTQVFGVLMSLEPAIAALAALALLDERLGPLQVAGMGLVIAASAGSTLASKALAEPVAN